MAVSLSDLNVEKGCIAICRRVVCRITICRHRICHRQFAKKNNWAICRLESTHFHFFVQFVERPKPPFIGIFILSAVKKNVDLQNADKVKKSCNCNLLPHFEILTADTINFELIRYAILLIIKTFSIPNNERAYLPRVAWCSLRLQTFARPFSFLL